MNNLKIQINNLHVRYEDKLTPCAVGITVNALNVISVDKAGKETTFKEDELIITKQCTLTDFSLYCCSHIVPILDAPSQVQIAYLKQTIATKTQLVSHFNYIIKPMSIDCDLFFDKSAPQALKDP